VLAYVTPIEAPRRALMNYPFTRQTQDAVYAVLQPRLPRLVILIAAVLTLSALLVAASTKHAEATISEKPTIVLVHGAWAGPGGWDQVVAGLHKDGYATVTPTLGLASLADDTATVRATLDRIKGDKILVGHSYGGVVVSNAASERSDVLGLVYTAGFTPDEGQTLVQLGEGYQPPAALLPGHLIFTGTPGASPTLIAPAHFREDFAQDLSPKLAATLSTQQRPTELALFFTPSGPVAWETLPSWYAVSGADRMIDPALQRAMAQKIGATTVEFDDASHAGGFTHYSARFVKLIEQAAQATTS
jgi:pimeloyl-ACP methyl ester carboxylesterase